MRLFNTIAMLFIVIALFSSSASGATVHGIIYDLSLNKVSGARVEVNTTPQQYLISKDGSYAFGIPNGFYTIKAELRADGVAASETKNISIKQDGDYVIDLILFPNFEEEDDIAQQIEIGIPETDKMDFMPLLALIVVFVLGAISYIIFKGKKTKEASTETEDSEIGLGDIIKIIKDEGGRATQKDIRKQIPLSEAKISLMVAELEHKGVIQKIKKGRGNIIILKGK